MLRPHWCLIHRFITHYITQTDCFNERCFDGRGHKLNKHRGLSSVIRGIDGCIILLLAIMDDGLYREPSKGRVPFGEQQLMPQATNAAISIGKGVD